MAPDLTNVDDDDGGYDCKTGISLTLNGAFKFSLGPIQIGCKVGNHLKNEFLH